MSAGTQISVEEYLKTVFRPDCDYVDGVVEERNLGELSHSSVQIQLGLAFGRFKDSGIRVYPELRMRLGEQKYRVPDLVVTRGKPDEQILTKAPLLCVEILSPEDRMSRVNQRIREYLDFGVPVVWLVDPSEKRIWIYRQNGMEEAGAGSVKVHNTEIEIVFSEIFE